MINVYIVSGFLGSGKTTFIQKLLREKKFSKVMLLENEFGEEGVDGSFFDEGLNVKEINNGCICCSLKGDFASALADIEEMGVTSQMIELKDGLTRINVKLKSDDESEINGSGPHIDQEAIDQLYRQLDHLQDRDILVLSGSIPSSLPDTIYQDIMAYLQNKDILYVVDATKDLLVNVLQYKPFLIKPNNFELAEIFHVELKNDDDIIYYAKKLQEKGARNVLISMAGDGSILVDENGHVTKMGVPQGKVKNSVGAGDSMLAGFIGGYLRGYDYSQTLALATACGSSTAFSDTLANQDEIDALFQITQTMI